MKQQLVDNLRRRDFEKFLRFYHTTIERRKSWLEFEVMRRSWELDRLDADRIDQQWPKQSDTLFVLGSGPSINELPPEFWDEVGRHDSVGFNFWLSHPFVPTVFHHELIDGTTPAGVVALREFVKLVDARKADYTNTAILLSELVVARESMLEALPAWWRARTVAVPTVYAVMANEDEGRKSIDYLKPYLTPGEFRRAFMYRSSVSKMVALGLVRGYRRIVLCGIDLQRPGYFFDAHERYPLAPSLQTNKVEQAAGRHITSTTTEAFAPVETAIFLMDELVMKPEGIELMVANESTALHPRLPVYSFTPRPA